MAKKKYEDDDGRTIADMSGLSRPSMFGHLPGSVKRGGEPQAETPEDKEQDPPYTPRERRMYALGALKAALLIGFAYLAGLAAVIGLMILVWSLF